ncbi:uncharacterized protein CEXT_643722 [Caerostris extrusa]|uniref:Uncharacterized protein n=1 Tax=Caerostris extrusa TaxID=172846 RepID=A0AAV4NHN2_CAEEX|nr:uncharacterized protein CEXT_643722 [Caerostris extrusa]
MCLLHTLLRVCHRILEGKVVQSLPWVRRAKLKLEPLTLQIAASEERLTKRQGIKLGVLSLGTPLGIGTNAEPPAQDSSHSVPELYVFSPVYLDWYVWMTIIIIGCIAIASVFLCLSCCRKPYKTAVVRLSEELPSHFPGTVLTFKQNFQPLKQDKKKFRYVLAAEGIIQPDVSFYTQVQPCSGLAKSPNINIHRLETPRLPTPCKPLEPAYQPTQLLTITTVRLPYLTSDLALPPGYVSLRDTK